MNKIYHKTDLYAQHLETYKNKRVCDEIQALTDGFHDLEAVYRDYVEHDSLDGFAVDFIYGDSFLWLRLRRSTTFPKWEQIF